MSLDYELPPPPIHLVPLAIVCARAGLKRSAIYKHIQAGTFPRPVKLSPGGPSRWRLDDVDRWLISRDVAGVDVSVAPRPRAASIGTRARAATNSNARQR